MQINAVIVDDDEAFRMHLHELLQRHFKEVHIMAVFAKPDEAILYLLNKPPDILFLDVEMPGITGVQLLEQIPNRNFEVIFTTSHDKYALDAIKKHAFDYLLKPVDKLELANTLARIRQKMQSKASPIQDAAYAKIPVFSAEGVLLLSVKDIVRCQADNNYTTFYLADGRKVVASKSMGEVETQLQPFGFFRPHKSHLINLKYLSGVMKTDGGYILLNDTTQVPLARGKKEELMQLLEQFLSN